jgi:hypothetical protein
MDMGTYFPCKWETSTFSRELPEKSTRGHTDFIYGIELSLNEETLCKKTEVIEAFFQDNHDNHRYVKVLSMQMWKTSTFSRELPEKSTIGHTNFIYGKSSFCGKTLFKWRGIIEIRLPR